MGSGLEPGQALDQGRYVIGELLGEGGMATVHHAWDSELDRKVAVKTMNVALAADASARARFRHEARAIARLSHPMVVSVYDVREEQVGESAVPYIVMEYVEGRTLAEWRPTGPGESGLDEALSVVCDVLSGLAASHARDIVHRDIKPANVMVCKDGSVKVMDFGIAHALDHQGSALTRTGFSVGTPHYMAPEQFESGRQVDGRTDLYAVGVMLFQLLTGSVPFDADSSFQIGYQHATTTPPTLADRGVRVSAELEAVVAKALAKSPDDRFPDAAAMRAAVHGTRAGASRPPAVRTPTTPVEVATDRSPDGSGTPAPAPQNDWHAQPTRTSASSASASSASEASGKSAPQTAAPPSDARPQVAHPSDAVPQTAVAEPARSQTPAPRPAASEKATRSRFRLLMYSIGLCLVSYGGLAPVLDSGGVPSVFFVVPLGVSAYGLWLTAKAGGRRGDVAGERTLPLQLGAGVLALAHLTAMLTAVAVVLGVL